MKKGKRILPVLLAVLFLALPFGASAQEDPRVFDEAGLFTQEQIQNLEDRIHTAEADSPWNYYIATTRDAGGRSARDYADDFYDHNQLGRGADKSGVLFLIDMDNREAYLSTCGAAVDYYTSAKIERILDQVTSHLSSGKYAAAASAFLSGAKVPAAATAPSSPDEGGESAAVSDPESAYAEGAPQSGGDSGENVLPYSVTLVTVSILVAVAAGGCFFLVIFKKYRGKARPYSYPLNRQSKLTLTHSEDRLINVITHTRQIPRYEGQSASQRSSHSGSTSRSHTSRSGVRHGGGGRKF